MDPVPPLEVVYDGLCAEKDVLSLVQRNEGDNPMTNTIPAGAFTLVESAALNDFISEQQPNLQQCLKFVEERGVEMKPAVIEEVETLWEFNSKRPYALADSIALNDFIGVRTAVKGCPPDLEMCLKVVEDRGVAMSKKVRTKVKNILEFALA